MTRVKICGITTPEDGVAAADCGADAIGLVFYPASSRQVDSRRARQIVEALPPMVSAVGVFVNHPDPQALEDLALSIGMDAVQLHGNESAEYCSMIQRVKVIKAFRVGHGFQPSQLRGYECGTFLLDSRSTTAPGGTGEKFDWSLAQGAEQYGRIILAGGIQAENVSHAIRSLRPWGVDVSSGVEKEPGRKDIDRMKRFITSVRETDVTLQELK